MSMLWLHYEMGWRLADFEGSVFERQLKSQTGLSREQILEALRLAKEMNTREQVLTWMANQHRGDIR